MPDLQRKSPESLPKPDVKIKNIGIINGINPYENEKDEDTLRKIEQTRNRIVYGVPIKVVEVISNIEDYGPTVLIPKGDSGFIVHDTETLRKIERHQTNFHLDYKIAISKNIKSDRNEIYFIINSETNLDEITKADLSNEELINQEAFGEDFQGMDDGISMKHLFEKHGYDFDIRYLSEKIHLTKINKIPKDWFIMVRDKKNNRMSISHTNKFKKISLFEDGLLCFENVDDCGCNWTEVENPDHVEIIFFGKPIEENLD